MANATDIKPGSLYNQGSFNGVVVTTAGSAPFILNDDAETVTSATAEEARDPSFILASSAGARGNVRRIILPSGANTLLVWVGCYGTTTPAVTASPQVVVLGKMPNPSDAPSSPIGPSVNSGLPTWSDGYWRACLSIDGDQQPTLDTGFYCNNQAGTNKEYFGGYTRIPLYGVREILVPVVVALALSAGTGGTIYGQVVA